MKTVNLQVTFTGRGVDDYFAAALEKAWERSATTVSIPIDKVTLGLADGEWRGTFMNFDFCQPNSLRIEKPL